MMSGGDLCFFDQLLEGGGVSGVSVGGVGGVGDGGGGCGDVSSSLLDETANLSRAGADILGASLASCGIMEATEEEEELRAEDHVGIDMGPADWGGGGGGGGGGSTDGQSRRRGMLGPFFCHLIPPFLFSPILR